MFAGMNKYGDKDYVTQISNKFESAILYINYPQLVLGLKFASNLQNQNNLKINNLVGMVMFILKKLVQTQ